MAVAVLVAALGRVLMTSFTDKRELCFNRLAECEVPALSLLPNEVRFIADGVPASTHSFFAMCRM